MKVVKKVKVTRSPHRPGCSQSLLSASPLRLLEKQARPSFMQLCALSSSVLPFSLFDSDHSYDADTVDNKSFLVFFFFQSCFWEIPMKSFLVNHVNIATNVAECKPSLFSSSSRFVYIQPAKALYLSTLGRIRLLLGIAEPII